MLRKQTALCISSTDKGPWREAQLQTLYSKM